MMKPVRAVELLDEADEELAAGRISVNQHAARRAHTLAELTRPQVGLWRLFVVLWALQMSYLLGTAVQLLRR